MTISSTKSGKSLLLAMLSYRRPAWSKTERRFIDTFLRPLGVREDAFGNLIKTVGDAPPEILWSSHTDTVHSIGGTQRLSIAGDKVRADGASNCLGADCTTGVWLMVEMIRADIPGLYIFHREEEMGGVGSDNIARKTPELLIGIKAAIAFDRKGTGSVITHQAGGRCCSDAFAQSLSDVLSGLPCPLRADSGGTFTDTANYVDLVGECTNISVGYRNQHTKGEEQDLAFALALRDALLSADLSQLVYRRFPGEVDACAWRGGRSGPSAGHGAFYGTYHWTDDEWWDEQALERERRPRAMTLHSIIRDYPDAVADWMEELGVNACDLANDLRQRGGMPYKY